MLYSIRNGVIAATLLAIALLTGCDDGRNHDQGWNNQASAPSQDAQAPGFEIGSGNVATADPTEPRPNTQPCVAQLYSNFTFNGFSSQNFSYAPPTGCTGPWAKIVLEADFAVNAGVQYDRTAHISVAGVNIYTGTTEEPSKAVAPSWHVERDLTEYAALFSTAQTGAVDVDNLVNSTYTGVITGSARLLFYPAPNPANAGVSADAVYAFSSGANGRPVQLNDSNATLSASYTFPTNVIRAYLDVIAQSQSNDEFWYTCAPDSIANSLQTCGSTAFRETEISIDGTPAGVAPVFPWIFTGGIDPGLWRNIPGVQTLNMQPYRVDLSPFAASLNDGKQHTISISVLNADSYFAVTAALLVYRDPKLATVTGGVSANTLTAPAAPTINNQVTFDGNGNPSGTLGTTSQRQFHVTGYINSSRGTETLDVSQTMNFSNVQTYTTTYTAGSTTNASITQDFLQGTDVTATSTVTIGNQQTALMRKSSYPLHLNFMVDSAGNQTSTVNAAIQLKTNLSNPGGLLYASSLNNQINNSSFYSATSAPNTQSAAQHFVFTDTQGSCYDRKLASTNRLLTSAIDSGACGGAGSIGRMPWYVDPLGGTGFIGIVGY